VNGARDKGQGRPCPLAACGVPVPGAGRHSGQVFGVYGPQPGAAGR
jgi:hypothetical protein